MKKKWIGLTVILIGGAALVVTGYLHWQHGQIFPTTENAYLGGDVFAVASRVPGTLLQVGFSENERVTAGQILAELDPRDFDMGVTRAEAEVAKAEASLALDEAQIAGAEAQLLMARSEAAQAKADRDRYAVLQQKGSAPERQYEQAQTTAAVAAARVTAAEKALAAAHAKLTVDQKSVVKSQAELANARLQRGYCTITAPCDGIVADKSAQPGQVVAPGQPLCRVAPLSDGHLWVNANFKETQLHRIRPGQRAVIKVDAIRDHEFQGTVATLSAGTGASFALLPPENASGNWVKIVQRLPVRIVLDAGDPLAGRLRLGLSAEVTVDTREPGDR